MFMIVQPLDPTLSPVKTMTLNLCPDCWVISTFSSHPSLNDSGLPMWVMREHHVKEFTVFSSLLVDPFPFLVPYPVAGKTRAM